jgi:hypothetical protein
MIRYYCLPTLPRAALLFPMTAAQEFTRFSGIIGQSISVRRYPSACELSLPADSNIGVHLISNIQMPDFRI